MKRCLKNTLCLGGLFLLCASSIFAQCNLSCQEAQVNVAINELGNSEITSDIFVTGMTGDCSGNLTIQVFNNAGTDLGNFVDCSTVGSFLTARITHDNTGNFCQSTLFIMDNIGPLLTCPNDTVNCSASTLPADVAPVIAEDNCDPNPTLNFSETTQNQLCSGQLFNRIITRTYNTFDINGNAGMNTCTQQIFVRAASLDSIVFPPNFDNIEENMLDCTADFPTSAVTGMPTLFGEAVQQVCKINIDSSDVVLTLCDGGFKVLRTWTALDCCTGETRTDTQVIKVADSTAPAATCPDPLTVGTDDNVCAATVTLPVIPVTDDCSSTIDIRIFSQFGIIDGNGGTVADIPVGTFNFAYRFRDACNNESLCNVSVTVADDEGPTMICEQFIDVSIGTAGFGEVAAEDLNEGSFDNCCSDLTFEVKRQGEPDTQYAAQETFDCTDLGLQTVTLRATDCNGFSNTCNIQVEVEDKTAPLLACPPPADLDCTQFPAGTDVAGTPFVFDNCGIADLNFTDVENLNSCNSGTVTRTFTATDPGGLSTSCTQTLTFTDNTPLVVTFPADTTLNNCGAIADPTVTGEPMTNADCELLGTSVQNDTFDLADGCGIKILRTFNVLNLCSGNTVSDVQEIKITDNEAPTFDQPEGFFNDTFSCNETIILPDPPTATDMCGTATVTLIDDAQESTGCGSNFTRTLTYRAEDDCGNTADFQTEILVEDTTPPVISCPVGLIASADENCERNLNLAAATATDDCSDFTISNDFPGAAEPNATVSGDFPLGETIVTYTATDDCGNSAVCLTAILIEDQTGPDLVAANMITVPIELPDTLGILDIADVLISNVDDCNNPTTVTISQDTFDCNETGSTVTVTLTGIDAVDNETELEVMVIVTDPDSLCFNERAAVTAGTVRRPAGEPIANVAVHLQNPATAEISTTSANGIYVFFHEFEEAPCQIIPVSEVPAITDVTSWDLLLTKRHILNIEPFTSPYQYFAADVNQSGTVTLADVVEMRRVILGVQTEFDNSPSYRFLPADYVCPAGENPFDCDIPESYLMTSPVWEEIDLDFIGIKVGDVSGAE